MKPKNIMLLGFVNKAVDYLDRHMDEEPDARHRTLPHDEGKHG